MNTTPLYCLLIWLAGMLSAQSATFRVKDLDEEVFDALLACIEENIDRSVSYEGGDGKPLCWKGDNLLGGIHWAEDGSMKGLFFYKGDYEIYYSAKDQSMKAVGYLSFDWTYTIRCQMNDMDIAECTENSVSTGNAHP